MTLIQAWLPIAALAILAIYALVQRSRRISLTREHSIRSYVFPGSVLVEFSKTYPQLEFKDIQLVARALRQFFIVHARSPNALVGMPSKAVDAMWHAFILDTRAYKAFCDAAFGSFFHHVTASSMKGDSRSEMAMWRTWRIACLEENINPVKATRLPLLFAIDSKLAIPGGMKYTPEMFERPKGSSGCAGGCGGSNTGDNGCGGGCGGGD